MIFFKNLFLLLILSVVLFAQESIIVSKEIISTDSPEELISNEVYPHEVVNPPQNINEIQEQMKLTIKNINLNTTKEASSRVDINTSTTTIENLPNKTFNEALAQAKNEHKIILLEIYGTDCHFCEKMDREVFPKESVIQALKDNFIILKINGDKEEIPLGITKQMTPMHVFVTATKDIKDMTFGFLDEKDFLELLDKEKS